MWYEPTCIKYMCIYAHVHGTHTYMKEIFFKRKFLKVLMPRLRPKPITSSFESIGWDSGLGRTSGDYELQSGLQNTSYPSLLTLLTSQMKVLFVQVAPISLGAFGPREKSPQVGLTAKEPGAFCWSQGVRTVSAASMISPGPTIPGVSEERRFCLNWSPHAS